MNVLCDAVDMVVPPSPIHSDISLDLDLSDLDDYERYRVVKTVTELYYLSMVVMIFCTYVICSDDGFDLSEPACRFLSIVNAMRFHLKRCRDLYRFDFNAYRLKRAVRNHKGRCKCQQIHKETGKCSSNLILSTLLHAHRDMIEDYDFLMMHLANQRHEEYHYWRDRRETVARTTFMNKLKRYNKVLKYNLGDTRNYQDLWTPDTDSETKSDESSYENEDEDCHDY